MAGYRSLLAFWTGGAGASAAPTQAGFRSLSAFWTGGAGASAAPVHAGFRSLSAFWAGGAGSSGVSPVVQAGFRSLLGFWVGGAGSIGGVSPVPEQGAVGDRIRRAILRPRSRREQELSDRLQRELLGIIQPKRKALVSRPTIEPSVHSLPPPVTTLDSSVIAFIVAEFEARIAARLLERENAAKLAEEIARNAEISRLLRDFYDEQDDIALILLMA